MVTKSVLVAGHPLQAFDRAKVFENGSATSVKGLVASKGTADNQLKILAASGIPYAVFDIQKSHVPIVSGKPNSDYAEPDYPVDYIRIAPGTILRLVLKAGETVLTDAIAYAEYGTGKIVAAAGQGPLAVAVGRAEVGAAAGQSDGEILVRMGDI